MSAGKKCEAKDRDRGNWKMLTRLTVLLLFISIVSVQAMPLDEVHNDPTKFRCLDCHRSIPFPGKALRFYEDIDRQCLHCHPDSHISGSNVHPAVARPSIDIPPDLPLDSSGRMTCFTCHYFHPVESKGGLLNNPALLRRPPGRNFCLACHGSLAW